MNAWLTTGADLLIQAVASFPDTLVTKQIPAEASWFQEVTTWASGLASIALLILAVALVPAAWNFRKSYAKISDMLDRIYGDINPLMRHASTIADNVNYISTSVRVDVQQVSQTIASANQRLMSSVELAEERIRELNALLSVVQEEAESAFVSTASTLRGVRTGIHQVFEKEELSDGRYIEGDDEWEKPRPRVRPRDELGR
ncbi:MAG: DUF948 domain-containing protein [Gemmatimonadaceae bacterium]|nr:DUF948 domain-containing protein [Gemmatimonadaceae bacterium]MDQ3082238.1 DUF948 domain-containing protein [Gemmatimonadota bacterium]